MYVVYREESSAQHGYGHLHRGMNKWQSDNTHSLSTHLHISYQTFYAAQTNSTNETETNQACTAENTYKQEYSNICSCFCFRQLSTASLVAKKAVIFDLFPVNRQHKQHRFHFVILLFHVIVVVVIVIIINCGIYVNIFASAVE